MHSAIVISPNDDGPLSLDVSSLTSPVMDGTALVTVPDPAFLTVRSATALLESEGSSGDVSTLPAPATLAAALLLIRSRPESFANLVPLLTQVTSLNVNGLALWGASDIAVLKGSVVHDKALQISRGVADEYAMVTAMFPNASWLNSLPDYQWAVSAVDACAVYVKQAEPLVIAPFVAAVARATAYTLPNATVSMSARGNFLFKKGSLLTLSTTRRFDGVPGVPASPVVVAGSPSEGDPASDADYLLQFGSLPAPDERMRAAELTFTVSPLDPNVEDKASVLQRAGLNTSEVFTLSLSFADSDSDSDSDMKRSESPWEPPQNMDAFLRLNCLATADCFLLERVFRQDVWSFMDLPVSKENELAVCAAVIGACDDALDAMDAASSPADDTDGPRAQMARRIIEGERYVLTKVAQHYREVEESVDVLEYYAERRLKALDLLRPLDESEYVDGESGAQVGRAFDDNYA